MVLSGALSKESPLPLSSNGSSSRLEVQDDEGESCTSLSVKFDLEKTTIHRHEVELEYDASNIWYNRAETRSFQISTLRSILACRQLIEEGRERDISEHHCVHGIEGHISSDSTRRNLLQIRQRVIFSVLNEQDRQRQEQGNINDHTHIAFRSMLNSRASSVRARSIGLFHERDCVE